MAPTESFYAFGSQRLWIRHPGVDNGGITAFVQFGIDDTDTLPVNTYFGVLPPTVTHIPNPGASPSLSPATAITLRATILF
jgi:carbohydrate-selective porin OprB